MKLTLPILISSVLLVSSVVAQRRGRDPLTPAEIDQIRDTAQEPEQRLKFYIKFTRDRIDRIQQVRLDPKITDKPQAIRERLQDFLDLYDELDENVDVFADRKNDIRKPLKLVIDADTEFESKLRALKDSAAATPGQASQYEFLLSNAIDAVEGGAKDHRDLLAEQEELAKKKKLIKAQ
jgi:hypothetical protein